MGRRLLARIVADLHTVLLADETTESSSDADEYAADEALPSGLWDPQLGVVLGGMDYSEEPSADERTSDGQEDE